MKRLDAEKRSTEEELKQRVSQCSKLSKASDGHTRMETCG